MLDPVAYEPVHATPSNRPAQSSPPNGAQRIDSHRLVRGRARARHRPRRSGISPASHAQRQADPHQITRTRAADAPRHRQRQSQPEPSAITVLRQPITRERGLLAKQGNRMSIRTRAIVPSTLLLVLASGANAADEAKPDPETFSELDRIVVTATLNERAQKDVAGDVTVIDALEIDRKLMTGLDDLVRYEPAFRFPAPRPAANRFGIGGITIRGLGGNRVRIEVDGIAVPDTFSIGSFSNAGREHGRSRFAEESRDRARRRVLALRIGCARRRRQLRHERSERLPRRERRPIRLRQGALRQRRPRQRGKRHVRGRQRRERRRVRRDASRRQRAQQHGRRRQRRFVAHAPNPQDTKSNSALAKYVHTAQSGRIDRVAIDGEHGDVDNPRSVERHERADDFAARARRARSLALLVRTGDSVHIASRRQRRLEGVLAAERNHAGHVRGSPRVGESDAALSSIRIRPASRRRRGDVSQGRNDGLGRARNHLRRRRLAHAHRRGTQRLPAQRDDGRDQQCRIARYVPRAWTFRRPTRRPLRYSARTRSSSPTDA